MTLRVKDATVDGLEHLTTPPLEVVCFMNAGSICLLVARLPLGYFLLPVTALPVVAR